MTTPQQLLERIRPAIDNGYCSSCGHPYRYDTKGSPDPKTRECHPTCPRLQLDALIFGASVCQLRRSR